MTRWALTTPPPLEIPTGASEWNGEWLSTLTALRNEAIGQGRLTVSPLQMALVAGTLANKGTMPMPHLALRLRDLQGEWYGYEYEREIMPRPVIAPDTAQRLLLAWKSYGPDVLGHLGTAVAGEDSPPLVWFLGIAPVDDPRYAAVVLLEHPAATHRAVATGRALLEAACQEMP